MPKIVVMNSSGNVGKSTITQLFSTKMEDTQIIEVETVNKGNSEVAGLNVMKFSAGDDFMPVYEAIVMNENVILDIGASSLGNFMDQISEYAGIADIFDLFIIPTIQDDKIQTDTFKSINFLKTMEVPEDKIKVIFNRVKGSVESEFAPLLNAPFDFDTSLKIDESSIFKELGFMRITADELFNPDISHYTKLMLSAKDPKEKALNLKKDLCNKMLHKQKENLDALFEAVTGLKPLETVKDTPKATKGKKTASKALEEPEEVEEEF